MIELMTKQIENGYVRECFFKGWVLLVLKYYTFLKRFIALKEIRFLVSKYIYIL